MPFVKVWPRDDNVRKLLKHPSGIGFNADPQFDPAEWPDDQVTTRRIQEGAVLIEAPTKPDAPVKTEYRTSRRSTDKGE